MRTLLIVVCGIAVLCFGFLAAVIVVKYLFGTPTTAAVAAPVAYSANTPAPSGDLGKMLGYQPLMIAIPGDHIDWDELAKFGFRKDTGLNGEPVYYGQSSTIDTIVLGLPNDKVATGATLIVGGVTVSGVVDGKEFSYTGGVLVAIKEGSTVTDLNITNGFGLLLKNEDAKDEYCARMAQARVEKWADKWNFVPSDWGNPVCFGFYTEPLDNSRPPVTP